MSTSWSQLMGGVLQSEAYKQAVYVAAGSYCQIVSMQEFNHIDAANTDPGSTVSSEGPSPSHKYLVAAALVGNLKKKVFMQSTFIVPSESPEVSLQDYRIVWDSTLGSFCVSRRSTGSGKSVPMAPVVLIEGSLLSKSQPYTAEELRSLLRPTPFNWADDVEDENEPISVQPTRNYMKPSCLTISTSSETPSASEPNSRSSTPITPFTPGPSPDLPSFEVDKSHKSPLILSLGLAFTNNKTDKPDGYQKFDWVNLIRHDGQCAIFQGAAKTLTTEQIWEVYKSHFSVSTALLHWSDLIVALDLAIPKEPECSDKSQDADQRPTTVVSKYLDIHEHVFDYAAHLAKTCAQNALSVPNAEVLERNLIADVVDDEMDADVEDGTAVEGDLQGEGKTGPSLASVVFEHIDLDAVFGGPADDLCEDYEGEHRAERADIDTSAPRTILVTRHLSDKEGAPNNVSTTTTKASQESYGHWEPASACSTLLRFVPVYLKDQKNKWSLLDWTDLLAATQRAKLGGSYKHKPLQATDRSNEWFWEPTNYDNRRHYDPRILSTAAGSCINSGNKGSILAVQEVEAHHFNYMQQPVFHKTDTPPEVSLWMVCSGQARHHEPISRKGVLSSQAGKLIDPFWYSGPNELLNCKGTQLRDEVTGYVEKLYHPKGTWIQDCYGSDETVPRVIEGDAHIDAFNAPDWSYTPQPVHRMLCAREVHRLSNDEKVLYPQGVDFEDATINDDGRINVHKSRNDNDWAASVPSKLPIVQACSEEVSDFEWLSRELNTDGLGVLTILPEQSEEAVAAENDEIYCEPAVADSPQLGQAEKSDHNTIASVKVLPNLVKATELEQTSNEPAHTDASNLSEAKKDERISDGPAVTDSAELAEAEEGEESSAEVSDDSDSSRTSSAQALRDFLESTKFVLTQKYVQALMDRKEDEAAEVMAQINELRASAPASNNTYVYSDDDDEDQVDYTDTWVKRNVRSVSNQEYLSRWSEIVPAEALEAGEVPREEDHAKLKVEQCNSSPAQTNDALATRSWSIGDNASPEELELERMDDESPMVIEQLRELGDLPLASPEGQHDSILDLNVVSASNTGKEESQVRPSLVSVSNEDLYADVLDLIRVNEILLACDDTDISQEDPKDFKPHEPNSVVTGDDIFTSRGYTRPMTIAEEEQELDRGHVAGMTLDQQSSASAEVLLNAYLGHLKRYHCKSWQGNNDKVSSLEVAGIEYQSPPVQQDYNAGKSSMRFLLSTLHNPTPAVAALHDGNMIMRKSYQYASSTLPAVPEDKEEDSVDIATDLSCSQSLQSSQQQNGPNVDISDFEQDSENMEDGLVWDEDSEVTTGRAERDSEDGHESIDTEQYETDVMSMSSEQLADMSTESLDDLLSGVSGLLAACPISEHAVEDSSADLDAISNVVDEDEIQLDYDTLEQDELVEEKELLAAEARKLADREKEVAKREEKLAADEKRLAQKEKDLAEEAKILAEEKAQLAHAKELADPEAEDDKSEEDAVDHAFDTISCPSEVPPAAPTFKEHFFGSFAIAVGGKASKLAMGLSGVLRSSAKVLHRG